MTEKSCWVDNYEIIASSVEAMGLALSAQKPHLR
ncbi:MAG UNVERIFIED_CONTAM: DUF3352 domain-containing protein [Microcystis novacekii LVE1205-3]